MQQNTLSPVHGVTNQLDFMRPHRALVVQMIFAILLIVATRNILVSSWIGFLHFPTDEHGLGQFDGTHLYEHADPRQGFHQDWQTLIYNYGRCEVANYLYSNAV